MSGLNLGQLPQTKEFKEKLSGKGVGEGAPNPFSYEHKISLDSASLSKLGVSTPKVGDKILLHAQVEADGAVGAGQSDPKKKGVHLSIHKAEGVGGSGGMKGAVESGIKQSSEGDE